MRPGERQPRWNRYVFRTGRNSGQDAISNALAGAKPGVSVATIAQDYAFGRDGVAAYKAALEKLGGKVAHEEYTPRDATDFTAPIQRIIAALKDKPEPKYVFVIWAGKGGPFPQLVAGRLDKHGIALKTGGNVLDVLKAWKAMNLEGLVGATYYYYEIPKNPVNDWAGAGAPEALQRAARLLHGRRLLGRHGGGDRVPEGGGD